VAAPFHLKGVDPLGTPGKHLYDAITKSTSPVFFIENKLQYLLKLLTDQDLEEYELAVLGLSQGLSLPTYQITLKSAPAPTVSLAAYGYMAHLALEALHHLAYQHEIFCELIIPTQLAPFELKPLFTSVRRTTRLLTIEEGTLSLGWGAEILARTSEALGGALRTAGRLAAKESVIPAAPDLEFKCLPDTLDIIDRVREMVEKNG
jgi:pyruvate/2-oxoglutarate/acetoin dehydrogenase E1 component